MIIFNINLKNYQTIGLKYQSQKFIIDKYYPYNYIID